MRIVAFVVLSCACGVAQAHVFLERAQPAVGSVLPQSPRVVRLWFSGEIEPATSRVQVLSAAGELVATAGVEPNPSDPGLVAVSLDPLPSGIYKVVWHVVSSDGHISEGDFEFRIEK